MDFSHLILGTFELHNSKRDIEFRQRTFKDEWDNQLVITEEQGCTEWRLNDDLIFQADQWQINYEHAIASEIEFQTEPYMKEELI